jgi:subtilisin family serine protease
MSGHRQKKNVRIPTGSRRWTIAIALIIASVGGLPQHGFAGVNAVSEAFDAVPFDSRIYIVQLAEPPALNYRGVPGGLGATRPAPGQRFDPDSNEVRQYAEKLTDNHDQLLHSIGAYADKLYSYRYAFNGFAARLTSVQAQKLRSNRNVLRVWEDQMRYLYTNDSPTFLGLFDASGGLITGHGLNGEDIVIGIIDSGIAPDHPSFSDSRTASRPKLCRSSWAEESLLGKWLCRRFKNNDGEYLTYEPPVDWNGQCETGDSFTSESCNNKIIGARFYADGFSQTHEFDPNEFMSPRDADGHGTHIASTAAGNEVAASLAGTAIDRVNGIAPRARIAVYKACWLEPGQLRGTCSTSDLQRAIEDAVADGVDIINYSVGNTDISLSDPDDLALLAAANAGVLPVVAAGNDGPHPLGNILSPSGAPWVLTVGASSRSGEKFEEALRVNAPASVGGLYAAREASFTPALKDAGVLTEELILADDASDIAFDACESLVNGNELSGKIAFLQRGTCDFEIKLKNAQTAGAIAVVVFNNQADLVIMNGGRGSVTIPAVMIGQADGQLLLDQINAGQSVELTLDKSLFLNISETGNVMASFSSSGPNNTAPDILKPDVTAPGVNILAGQTPDLANGIQGETFQYLSGTSMAVPHVAGIAALIKQAHPEWSPAAIKSALMTTAHQDVVKAGSTTPADAFDMGGGHVVPNSAVDPGLVYEAGKEDYDAFTCGTPVPRVSEQECRQLINAGFPSAAADLNLPTIALSTLVSSRTIRRQVTNVGSASQYRVEIDAPPGIDVEVNPAVLSLGAGETAAYEATFSPAGANLTEWGFGALRWVDGSHVVRSPVAMRPVQFLAPLEITATGTSGSLIFDVEFGYTGAYETALLGLAAPYSSPAPETVADDPLNNYVFEPDTDQLPGSIWRSIPPLIVDETDIFLRVALFNEHTDGDDDLDLYVYRCDFLGCDPVGIGGSFDSNEQIDVLYPEPGEYFIDVHGFETDQVTGGPGAEFTLFVWTVGPNDELGNVSFVAPNTAVTGETAEISLSWDSIDQATHLGAITHGDGSDLSEITIVTIEN